MSIDEDQFRPGIAFLALFALMCAVSATVLEGMAVSVALPAIARDFGISASTATWVVATSQFVIVALLLPMAALGDVIGYRKVLLGSLLIFSAASLVCMMSQGFTVIVVARAFQAVGTAGTMSIGFAVLRFVFPDARLGTAIGMVAATVAIASSIGPAVSGLIITVASWREIFGLISAISLFALVFGAIALPAVPPSGRHYDLPGAALVAGMLASLLSLINGLSNGWPLAVLVASGAAFSGLLIIVLMRSRRVEAPVFPIDLLGRPVLGLSVCASICVFTAQTLGFILLPFYLLYGAQMDEVQMAATLSAWPATTAILAPVLGRVAHRIPAGPAGAVGLGVMAIGFYLLSSLDDTVSHVAIGAKLAMCGAGFALFQTPNNRLVLLTTPKDRSGAASGILSVARQFGRALGTAIAAFALTAGPTQSLGALLAAAGIVVLGAMASAARVWAIRHDMPDA